MSLLLSLSVAVDFTGVRGGQIPAVWCFYQSTTEPGAGCLWTDDITVPQMKDWLYTNPRHCYCSL